MDGMDETYMEDDHEVGIKHCNGFDVYYNYHGEGEYSVGEHWYSSLEEAIRNNIK